MKYAVRILLIIALAALPMTAAAGDFDTEQGQEFLTNVQPEDFSEDFSGGIQLGGDGILSGSGSPDKALEYEPDNGSPTIQMLMNTHQDWGSLSLGFNYLDVDDNAGHLNFDLGRMVRSHTDYTKFIHRFGHDEMNNLEGTSTNGKVVWHTDLSPMSEYGINYQLLHNRTEFQFEAMSNLTLAIDLREQKRSGHKQAYTTSHCDTCHVYSQDHRVDERTRDAKLEATFGWKGGSMVASWNTRALSYQGNSVLATFDDALHPEAQTPVFDNRLQYDSNVGAVPADLWPNQEKSTGRLDFNFNDLGGFAVNLGGVLQESKNNNSGNSATYKGMMLNISKRFGKSLTLRFRGRGYNMDNDAVWIDVNDRPSIAGPHAGLTYEDWTGRNFDHYRRSALDRDVIDTKLDLAYRVSRKMGTFRLKWNYLSEDRQNYEVAPGKTETTKNVIGLHWRAHPSKNFKLQAYYDHGDISHPFMVVDGTCSTLISGSNSNPWDPDLTAQYYEFHEARVGDSTASPDSYDEFKLAGTFNFGSSMSMTASYHWWDGDNTSGNLTNWSKTNNTFNLTFWSAPASTWSWYLGYTYLNSDLDAPACIPVFDG